MLIWSFGEMQAFQAVASLGKCSRAITGLPVAGVNRFDPFVIQVARWISMPYSRRYPAICRVTPGVRVSPDGGLSVAFVAIEEQTGSERGEASDDTNRRVGREAGGVP